MEAQTLSGLQTIATAVANYMVPLAAASGLTVALLEAFKKLFSIRGSFHRRAVARWLAEDHRAVETAKMNPLAIIHGTTHYDVAGNDQTAKQLGARFAPAGAAEKDRHPLLGAYNADKAYQELKTLTTGVRQNDVRIKAPRNAPFRSVERAVFELEIGRMMSQIQDAADAVLQNPTRCSSLYLFLTRGCDPADIAEWAERMENKPTGPDPTRQAVMAELYGRIRLLVKRQLDSFQTVTSYRWDELNQLWAIVVGAIILYAAQLIATNTNGVVTATTFGFLSIAHLKIACLSLLGGVLAPIAKDLISALSDIKFSKS